MARARVAPIVGGLSGKLGEVVFASGPLGTQIRPMPQLVNPRTPAQVAARDRIRRVGRAWRDLDPARVAAWRGYALAQPPGPGGEPPRANTLFSALGVRALMAGGPLPLDPPGAPFLGDSVRLTAGPGPGAVRVVASGPNTPGVVTELLLQRLGSANCRTYLSRYRTARVLSFTAPGPLDLPAYPGTWAIAARFILTATGQATGLAELGVVRVSG